MRIDDTYLSGVTAPQSGKAGEIRRTDENRTAQVGNSAASTDQVQLSDLSGKISRTLEADASARTQRVQELAASVRAGTYVVNEHAVSRAIISESLAASNAGTSSGGDN